MFQGILKGLTVAAARDGYRVLVADSAEAVGVEAEIACEARSKCDALVLVSPRMPDPELRDLIQRTTPVVVVNRRVDDSAAAQLSVDYAHRGQGARRPPHGVRPPPHRVRRGPAAQLCERAARPGARRARPGPCRPRDPHRLGGLQHGGGLRRRRCRARDRRDRRDRVQRPRRARPALPAAARSASTCPSSSRSSGSTTSRSPASPSRRSRPCRFPGSRSAGRRGTACARRSRARPPTIRCSTARCSSPGEAPDPPRTRAAGSVPPARCCGSDRPSSRSTRRARPSTRCSRRVRSSTTSSRARARRSR